MAAFVTNSALMSTIQTFKRETISVRMPACEATFKTRKGLQIHYKEYQKKVKIKPPLPIAGYGSGNTTRRAVHCSII